VYRSLTALLACAALAACATLDYNLPAVTDNTDGNRDPGKFVWHDLISDDPAGSEAFYSALFGWEFRSLKLPGAGYWVISLDGEPIGGMVSQASLPARKDISQWVSVLSVADPAAAAATVRDAGGSVLREPVSLGERGTIAVFSDVQGALFAGLKTGAGDPRDRDRLPAEGAFFWHELWTSDASAATDFYAGLTGLSVKRHEGRNADGERIALATLRDGKRPRAGVRPAPLADMPSLWMPYLRVGSQERLDALLAEVPRLNGRVLVPAIARPAGGFLAVIAGPSGAPVALQTWDEDDRQRLNGVQADAG
jgi:predicted enzyme related to lactoylglutathione lyase